MKGCHAVWILVVVLLYIHVSGDRGHTFTYALYMWSLAKLQSSGWPLSIASSATSS